MPIPRRGVRHSLTMQDCVQVEELKAVCTKASALKMPPKLKEQLKAFGVAEESLVPTPHVVARTDRPESVGRAAPDAAERARERRTALAEGRWSIADAIAEASHSVRPHIDALYMPNTRFTVLIYLTGQLVEGGETLIVDEVAGDVVASGVQATPRAGRAFVYSSTAENVHTSLGSLRGTRSMLQFWFEARI